MTNVRPDLDHLIAVYQAAGAHMEAAESAYWVAAEAMDAASAFLDNALESYRAARTALAEASTGEADVEGEA